MRDPLPWVNCRFLLFICLVSMNMIDGYWHNKAAFDYNCAVHSELMSICKPLFANFGIKNFRYMKMYNNYKYISLGTNLKYLEAYLQNIDQPGRLFEPSEIYSKGIMDNSKLCHFLWPNQYHSDEKDPLFNLMYEFDVWHGFTISRAIENYVEIWSFTADKSSTGMTQFYMNNQNILDCFVLYFDLKIQDIVINMPKEGLARFKAPFDMNMCHFTNPNEENICNFFKSLDLSNFPISTDKGNAHLTCREVECFTHIALGYTAKQVGNTLNISSRTVEAHLNSIKQKLGVYYKSDIVSLIPHDQLLLLKKIFLMKNGEAV